MTRNKIILTTLLVLVAVGVMLRLGVWQLDRLAQRRAFNAEVSSRTQAPKLTMTDLTGLHAPSSPAAEQNMADLSYRAVELEGKYDFTQQVALNNQSWQGQPGMHLITPLVLAGSDRAVLVDRGWIPSQESAPANWSKFDEPGVVKVLGRIHLTQTPPLPVAPPTRPLDAWYRVDIAALQRQISHPLLMIYVVQSPDPARKQLPYRTELTVDLTEGPHMGYAITWFALAAILGFGYAGYLLKPMAGRMAIRKSVSVEK